MAKNAPFHIKSPVKIFNGRAKGGASHRAPLYTPLLLPIAPIMQSYPLLSIVPMVFVMYTVSKKTSRTFSIVT